MIVLQAWASAFGEAWVATTTIMATMLGIVAGVFLFILVAAVMVAVIGTLLAGAFDRITNRMADRWEKTGRKPHGRWAEVIAGGKHREK